MKRRSYACILIVVFVLSALQNYKPKNVLAIAHSFSEVQSFEEQIIVVEDETGEEFQQIEKNNKVVSPYAISINGYSGKYGYNQLASKEQKTVYRMLEKEAQRFHASSDDVRSYTDSNNKISYYAIDVSVNGIIHTSDVGVAIVSLLYDHPEYFWSKGYSYYVRSSDYMVTKVILQCQEEYYDGTLRAQKRDEIQEEIEQYLDLIVGVQDEYQREKILHDALAQKITYAYKSGTNQPEDARWAHTIEGVFSSQYYSVVCEGYAKAFHLLLNAAGIESVYVVGKSRGMGHAWNQVKIDGEWYNVDITWNDTGNVKNYKYFNVSDDIFSMSHAPFSVTNTPTVGEWCYETNNCNSTIASYTNKGEGKTDEVSCVVNIKNTEQCDLKVYHKGIEVKDGDMVVSGSALDVWVLPIKGYEHLQVTTYMGNKEAYYAGVLPKQGLHYDFLLSEQNDIYVEAKELQLKLRLKHDKLTFVGIGKKKRVDASIYPAYAQGEILWKSSNKDVAIVKNGQITSVSTGSAIITAYTRDKRLKAKCKVVVKEPYVVISSKKNTIKVGKTIKLSGKAYGINGKIKWSVSNTKKAKIGKNNGVLKAKKPGTVTVIAKIGTVVAKKKITIKK